MIERDYFCMSLYIVLFGKILQSIPLKQDEDVRSPQFEKSLTFQLFMVLSQLQFHLPAQIQIFCKWLKNSSCLFVRF